VDNCKHVLSDKALPSNTRSCSSALSALCSGSTTHRRFSAAYGRMCSATAEISAIPMARVDPQTRAPIGRRRNKATSLIRTYRADQWASCKATHNPTRQENQQVAPLLLGIVGVDALM
jgi:hypothetical protein